MAQRHQQLEDSLRLQQFSHDVEEERRWVGDREPLAASTDLRRHSLTHSLSRPKSDQTDFGQKGYHIKGRLKRNRMTQISAS